MSRHIQPTLCRHWEYTVYLIVY